MAIVHIDAVEQRDGKGGGNRDGEGETLLCGVRCGGVSKRVVDDELDAHADEHDACRFKLPQDEVECCKGAPCAQRKLGTLLCHVRARIPRAQCGWSGGCEMGASRRACAMAEQGDAQGRVRSRRNAGEGEVARHHARRSASSSGASAASVGAEKRRSDKLSELRRSLRRVWLPLPRRPFAFVGGSTAGDVAAA
jgi:hypothetical protein